MAAITIICSKHDRCTALGHAGCSVVLSSYSQLPCQAGTACLPLIACVILKEVEKHTEPNQPLASNKVGHSVVVQQHHMAENSNSRQLAVQLVVQRCCIFQLDSVICVACNRPGPLWLCPKRRTFPCWTGAPSGTNGLVPVNYTAVTAQADALSPTPFKTKLPQQ